MFEQCLLIILRFSLQRFVIKRAASERSSKRGIGVSTSVLATVLGNFLAYARKIYIVMDLYILYNLHKDNTLYIRQCGVDSIPLTTLSRELKYSNGLSCVFNRLHVLQLNVESIY